MHHVPSSRLATQVRFVACTAAVAFFLVSCGPKARIVGEIHDGFGKPLSDVDVSIPNTAFKSASGSNGRILFLLRQASSPSHLRELAAPVTTLPKKYPSRQRSPLRWSRSTSGLKNRAYGSVAAVTMFRFD
jgi:hypothetical protein